MSITDIRLGVIGWGSDLNIDIQEQNERLSSLWRKSESIPIIKSDPEPCMLTFLREM
jgi:hypothetical protein